MTKEQAVAHFGGVPRLAEALGIQRQAIYQWDEIPELRQLQIERLTDGALQADSSPVSDRPRSSVA